MSFASVLRDGACEHHFIDPARLSDAKLADPASLPFCLRVLLENMVRNASRLGLEAADIARLGRWRPGDAPFSVSAMVTRVVLPDSSGLPALLDLAALRSEIDRSGGDPTGVEPLIPVHLVVDHSLIVDAAGRPDASRINEEMEFRRNSERYSFLKWAQQAFRRLKVVPPGMGIIHQVHLERIARVVATEVRDGRSFVFPEFVLGGDSHTPMVGALGLLGWGVGGIEIEDILLGAPSLVRIAGVVGVRLRGALRPGVSATDLVLTLTERLRAHGVVGRFVEFAGPGVAHLPVADRATLANMAPEYGATIGFFPIDEAVIDYLRITGRDADHVALVEKAARAIGLFRVTDGREPDYSETIDVDLGEIETSIAGPRRPQDRLSLSQVPESFAKLAGDAPAAAAVPHGAVAIAAITSCTNTSNPASMLAAGLLARRAVELGLAPPAWVKTSLAPGSRVVVAYLERAGLMEPLERLGFHVVGFGCTTCSGKSGDLAAEVARSIAEDGLVVAAILSGNRNFDGRIHPQIRANYLVSPMLVVAFALAGRVDFDLAVDPIGMDREGRPVGLADLWPDAEEIARAVRLAEVPELYSANYADLFAGTENWRALHAPSGPAFPWPADSSAIVEPPFFSEGAFAPLPDRIEQARLIGLYGDMLTTDHICPAGRIAPESASGQYLLSLGVAPAAFNAYTQYRGNHEVMVRAIFASSGIVNRLEEGLAPGATLLLPEAEVVQVHEAAELYRARGVTPIVMAGSDYGMGSSRDWAAKGPALLGVKAVIARSFERIHRANLVALGIVPLAFARDEDAVSLGLTGRELFRLEGLQDAVGTGVPVKAFAENEKGGIICFQLLAQIESRSEAESLAVGGAFARIRRLFAPAFAVSAPSQAAVP